MSARITSRSVSSRSGQIAVIVVCSGREWSEVRGGYGGGARSPSPLRGRVGWGCAALALTRDFVALPLPLPPPRRGGGVRSVGRGGRAASRSHPAAMQPPTLGTLACLLEPGS